MARLFLFLAIAYDLGFSAAKTLFISLILAGIIGLILVDSQSNSPVFSCFAPYVKNLMG
jgi:hypothetical protein